MRFLQVASVLFFVATAVLFFPFTADDSFITARYADNLVRTGQLVYNSGERVLACTSPLWTLLLALFQAVTRHPVLAAKIVGLLLAAVSCSLAWRSAGSLPVPRGIVLLLCLASPCVVLWAVSGMETSLVMILATALAAKSGSGEIGPKRFRTLAVLSGLLFLARYDSVLFSLPLLAASAVCLRRPRAILSGLAWGAILPATWLVFSRSYYGDVFPTSFYVKSPRLHPVLCGVNALYMMQYLLLTGLLPVILGASWAMRRNTSPGTEGGRSRSPAWGLWVGLAAALLYGLAVATTHMMFSFRFFVPFIPAAALAVGHAVTPASTKDGVDRPLRISKPLLAVAACALIALQGVHTWILHRRSLNGFLAGRSEYTRLGAQAYARDFIPALRATAADVRQHWTDVSSAGRERPPRIMTFAAGAMPYHYLEAYLFEDLVSYREHVDYENLGSWDYLHILVPRHGAVRAQLPGSDRDYSLVSSHALVFDGALDTMMVFYNPHPGTRMLPARIHDPPR